MFDTDYGLVDKTYFSELQYREVGDDLAVNRFPDDGNGRYIQNRPYTDWLAVNRTRRIRGNYVDHLCFMAPLSLVNGVFFPLTTSGLVAAQIAGRTLYANGYLRRRGDMDTNRIAGSMMANLSSIGTIALFLVLGLHLQRGKIAIKYFK